jgi:hypothetical protein
MNKVSSEPHQLPESETPKPKKDGNDIKWYDKRLMVPSLIIWLVLSGLFYALAMRHKPPEGFVFEREPVLSGTYKCCEAGGRSSQSWVGGRQISCKPFGYHSIGRNLNDCGFKEQLNGHPVEVTRAFIPSARERDPIVVRITSQGQTYYDVSDQRIRERWISESTSGAVLLAFIFSLLFHLFLRIYLAYFHKPTPRKGDQ